MNIGMYDIHSIFNNILKEELDKTYKIGLTCINSISALLGIIEVGEGCRLIKANKIIITDYRIYLVNMNLKSYFSE